MSTQHFDALVIGAGQAGPAMAARCSRQGLKVAMVERKRFGGTCVNNGCIPTKTMVASARAVHMARRGAEFGFSAADVRVDMARVRARKDEVVAQSSRGVEAWLRGLREATVYNGHARFTGPRSVEVDTGGEPHQLTAERVFIDVGGRAVVPDLPGIDSVRYYTNADIMDLEVVPEHLVIVGGSYIGLEFAQMMRRFGAQVTVVEKGAQLLPREDRDIADGIRAILEAEGVQLRLNAQCMAVRAKGERIEVGVDCDSGAPAIEGSHLLLAVGRQPNTADLGLEHASIATDERGFITVDDALHTSAEGVWALGECNGRGAFTHTTWNDYEIVAQNLFDGRSRKVTDRIGCYALFIDPPLGRVGLTEQQVRQRGRPALVATLPMVRVGRAREQGETQGFMKALVDAQTRHILGAAILGWNGDEVIHEILLAMHAGVPPMQLQDAVHIHPTVSELLPTLFEQLRPLPPA
ncbi:MAG: FAD-containing oxidoreductase [Betaproteobacteria bacterium]|nr:FAD-containing oxidoreductase [Betaproteobacteria bacterium]